MHVILEVLVFNVSSYEYYMSGDASTEITERSVISFLERIAAGDVQSMGGRSIIQQIKRVIYEVGLCFFSFAIFHWNESTESYQS